MTKPKSYIFEGYCQTCARASMLDRGRCVWCETQVQEMPNLRRVPHNMTDETVERGRVLYFTRGLSLRKTAEVLLPDTDYTSAEGLANALMRQFRHRGLALRTKKQAGQLRRGAAA